MQFSSSHGLQLADPEVRYDEPDSDVYQLAVNPNGTFVYMDADAQHLLVVSTATNAVPAVVPLGAGAFLIALNVTPDGKEI